MTHLQAVAPPMPMYHYKVTIAYRLASDRIGRSLHSAWINIEAINTHEASEAAIAQVRASGGIVQEVVNVETIDPQLFRKKQALGLV